MSRASLDWSDPTEVAIWLAGLRQSFADLDAAGLDMLRPPRHRELGPALHADHYRNARAQIVDALYFAGPDEHGDPAGAGGAGGK